MYIICIYMYALMYMYMSIYLYVRLCSYMVGPMYVLVHTFICIKVIYLIFFSCRHLGCYLLVWNCYLGSILAFPFKLQNLNTTICAKTSKST